MDDVELTPDIARDLAGTLVTIGHPYSPVAIAATGIDIYEMCKGIIGPAAPNGQRLTRYEQAHMLVTAARNWTEGWPERGGTAKLKQLFRELFPSRELEALPVLTHEEAVARGMIHGPCEACNDKGFVGTVPNIDFCFCYEGRYRRWEGANLARLNTPPEPEPAPPGRSKQPGGLQPVAATITIASVRELLEASIRRKQEELKRLASQQEWHGPQGGEEE